METSKKKPKWILFPIFAITLCFLLPTLLLAYDSFIYPLWTNFVSPRPQQVDFSDPQLISEGLEASILEWSDDGSKIRVHESNWTMAESDAPDTIRVFDTSTGRLIDIYQENTVVEPNRYECTFKNTTIVLGSPNENENWSISLFKDNRLIKEFHFSPVYTGGERGQYQGAYSPKCSYFTFTIDGWLYHEGNGPQELWLLDIQNETILPIVIGRWPILRLWDYPVQSVQFDWSPDEKEIVFGDSNFGLEIYNIQAMKRRWLAGSGTAGWAPQWSYDGSWIASNHDYSILLLSPDGKKRALAGECSIFPGDIVWSPISNKLAYLCHHGKEKDYTDSLWIWTIE